MIVIPPVQERYRLKELIDINTPAFKTNPLPFYARLRDEQPVYRARSGSVAVWLVTRYDDVLAVLKDERFVKSPKNVLDRAQAAKPPWVPWFVRPLMMNMLDQDAPVHPRLRGLVQKAFTPRRVEELQGKVQQIADRLLDAAEHKGSFDLIEDFALPLPLTVIIELLGVPHDQRELLRRWSHAIFRPYTPFNMVLVLPPTVAILRELRALFEQRRREPQDDLLTALVQAEEAGDRLNEDELAAMVLLLLVAGHETTVNLISSGTLALLQHPAQLERLRADPALIKPAIEELLRFTSPVETTTERYAREPTSIAGQAIGPGEMVLVALASANRDERHFTQPDTLDLGRTPNRHLAFGHGPHFCLGASLARMEGQIAIATLLRRMPNLRLAVPTDQLRWRGTPVVRGLAALPVSA